VQITAQSTGNIQWTGSGYLSDANSLTPMVSPITDALYIAEVQEAGFCNSKDTVVITVAALPVVDAGISAQVCAGSSWELSGFAEGTFGWIADATLSSTDVLNPSVTPLADTWYYLQSIDSNGCEQLDSVLVIVDATLQLTVSNDTTICSGVSVQLSASGATDYTWNNAALLDNSTLSNPVANLTTSTEFIVTASNAGNCITQDTVLITVYDAPLIAISSGGTFCDGEGVEIFVAGVSSVTWSPSAGLVDPNAASTLANPSVQTTYTADYIDANGCSGIAGTSTVIPGDLPVTGFTFNQISNYVVIFESDVQVNQTTTWQMNGIELFGDSVSYDFPFDDTYTVTQIVSNSCGSDTLVLDIEVIKQVGFEDVDAFKLNLYPNPASEQVLISTDKQTIAGGFLQVYGSDGKLIHQENLINPTTILDVSSWSSGMYEFTVQVEGKVWRSKFIR
jgi:hypothetical protein